MKSFDLMLDSTSANLKDLIANDERISESDIDDVVGDIYNKNILDLTEKEFNTLDNCAKHLRWTYFKLDTAKGGVNLRFIGSSNGYYSINMDFKKLEGDEALMYIEMSKNDKTKKKRKKPSIH